MSLPPPLEGDVRSNANVYAVPSRHYVDRYGQSHIELVCTLTLMEESDTAAINAIDYQIAAMAVSSLPSTSTSQAPAAAAPSAGVPHHPPTPAPHQHHS
jgi:hypothetical protein